MIGVISIRMRGTFVAMNDDGVVYSTPTDDTGHLTEPWVVPETGTYWIAIIPGDD